MANQLRQQEAKRDRALVKRARGGDEEAFKELVLLYQDRIHRLVFGIVRSEEDARDIAQEVFVKIYYSLKDFRSTSSFFTWAYRIAFNLSVDWKRKFSKIAQRTDSQQEEKTGEVVSEIASDELAPDERVYQLQQRAAINEALLEMNEEQRSVVMLREVDGLSYEEISEVTGLPKGTVMSRLFYGRRRLMELLSKFRMKEHESTSNRQKDHTYEGLPALKTKPFRPLRDLKSVNGS